VIVYVGVRQRGAGAVQRPAVEAAADASCLPDAAGSVLSPGSSESSGVGSKHSSLDNLLYVERNDNHFLSAHSSLLSPCRLVLSAAFKDAGSVCYS